MHFKRFYECVTKKKNKQGWLIFVYKETIYFNHYYKLRIKTRLNIYFNYFLMRDYMLTVSFLLFVLKL